MTLGLRIAASGAICFLGLLLWAAAFYEQYEPTPEWIRHLVKVSLASIPLGLLIYVWGG